MNDANCERSEPFCPFLLTCLQTPRRQIILCGGHKNLHGRCQQTSIDDKNTTEASDDGDGDRGELELRDVGGQRGEFGANSMVDGLECIAAA